MAQILVVEDDGTLGLSLTTALSLEGHAPHLATDLAHAREHLQGAAVALVILDLGLPDGDGLDLCRELHTAKPDVAVLVLTARGTVDARVEGLRAGADDYLPKPFHMAELLARVEALLRRRPAPMATRLVEVGSLRVDLRARTADRGGTPVPLTELEMRLLDYLDSRRGEAVTREELLEQVWGLSSRVKTRTVDMFISRLRRLVEADPTQPRHLTSVRGFGYRLEQVEVTDG